MIIMDAPDQFGFICPAGHRYRALHNTALWERCKAYADAHDGAVMPITTDACYICTIDHAYEAEYLIGGQSDNLEGFVPASQTHGNCVFPSQSMFAQ